MKKNALAIALLTTATAMSGSAHSADDFCSRMFIYAINQICHLLPNGQSICQPIGLTGPDPTCSLDSTQPLTQVPLGPPVLMASPFESTGLNPYTQTPFTPLNLFPNSYFPNMTAPAAAYLPAQTPPTASGLVNLAAPRPISNPESAIAPVNVVASAEVNSAAANVLAAPQQLEKSPLQQDGKGLDAVSPASAPTTESSSTAGKELSTTLPAAPSGEVIAGNTGVDAVTTVPEIAKPSQSATVASSATIPATDAKAPIVTITSTPTTTSTTSEPAPDQKIAVPIAVEPLKAVDPIATVQAEKTEKTEKMHDDVLAHFEFDRAELTPVGRAMLDSWLTQSDRNAPIVVTGHADRLGPEPYNEKLSKLRAEAVKKYLTDKGKPANLIQILAKGEAMPIISCAGDINPETKSCLAPNRRAEVAAQPSIKTPAKPAVKKVVKAVAKPAAKKKKAPVKKAAVKPTKH